MGTNSVHIIYLGKRPDNGVEDWDNAGGNPDLIVQNRNSFNNWNSSEYFGDKLFQRAETATLVSNNPYDAWAYEDSTAQHSDYNQGKPAQGAATISWSGGNNQKIDSIIQAKTVFTYTDGTTSAPINASYAQTLSGDTFLLSLDSNSAQYTEKPIASIAINDSSIADYDRVRHGLKTPNFPLPKTPFKTEWVVEGLWHFGG